MHSLFLGGPPTWAHYPNRHKKKSQSQVYLPIHVIAS